MALVFEGRHAELGSRVALKAMQPALAAQPLAAARFLREAKAASHIRHPNVVEVFDIGTENGLPFIVMEFIDGSNLAALLAADPCRWPERHFLAGHFAVATAYGRHHSSRSQACQSDDHAASSSCLAPHGPRFWNFQNRE
jgi:serine/threonine protein kinase